MAEPGRRRLFALALGLFAVIAVFEVVVGPALRPATDPHHDAAVLAIPGVAALLQGTQIDPTEITQVAARQHQPAPMALPAQALIDGLLVVGAAALALPRLLPGRDAKRGARLGAFLGSLGVLLGGIVVVVAAVARLRFLVALYLSPPFGTVSYLLLYGSFRRTGALSAMSVLMAMKVGACVILLKASSEWDSERGIAGLALTSVGATVLTTACYALAPPSLAGITDALAAALVAAAAVLWAGVMVSGSVRRL